MCTVQLPTGGNPIVVNKYIKYIKYILTVGEFLLFAFGLYFFQNQMTSPIFII
jgi:hypothetical protein